eukprot:TRINITY_DN1805_c0_g1_i1.p1 TRINITY_DN1805_c0_g1~~TRINITY_DN1805_c0_g1_i1.p1  ORF type:complete len:317 (-),score=122.47 TRINITY_DN1805_c0_g1_i1:1205-2155(-)
MNEEGSVVEEGFFVENILDRKKVGKQYMCLVKWIGYGMDELTWEPESQLMEDVPEIMTAYLERVEKEKEGKKKPKRRERRLRKMKKPKEKYIGKEKEKSEEASSQTTVPLEDSMKRKELVEEEPLEIEEIIVSDESSLVLSDEEVAQKPIVQVKKRQKKRADVSSSKHDVVHTLGRSVPEMKGDEAKKSIDTMDESDETDERDEEDEKDLFDIRRPSKRQKERNVHVGVGEKRKRKKTREEREELETRKKERIPMKVSDCRRKDDDVLFYKIEWKDAVRGEESSWLPAPEVHKMCPMLIVEFMESRLRWHIKSQKQ